MSPVSEQLADALAAFDAALDRLELEISSMPADDVPGVRGLPGGKAFVVDFLAMSANGVWSAHYYDLRRQYQLVIEEMRRVRREFTIARLRSVVTAGAIGVGRNATKLHPEVLARLSALLPQDRPMPTKTLNAVVTHNGTACRVLAGRYSNNGRLAMSLVEIATGEPWATATVNLSDEPLEYDCVFIKDYAENAGVAAALVAAGLVQITDRSVSSGYVEVDEYRLSPEVRDWLVAEGVLVRPEPVTGSNEPKLG